MQQKNEHLDALHDIKSMMERSSRFISLSGLSGIAAGVCALVASVYSWILLDSQGFYTEHLYTQTIAPVSWEAVSEKLIIIGAVTFVTALGLAFIFTYLRSRKAGVPIWGVTARRLLWNTFLPLVVGGVVVIWLLQHGILALVAPMCLLFYGLALINGSKYTLQEVRWLGYGQIILGITNLWMIGCGLILWAVGFGILHIIYGAVMWWKYEKQ